MTEFLNHANQSHLFDKDKIEATSELVIGDTRAREIITSKLKLVMTKVIEDDNFRQENTGLNVRLLRYALLSQVCLHYLLDDNFARSSTHLTGEISRVLESVRNRASDESDDEMMAWVGQPIDLTVEKTQMWVSDGMTTHFPLITGREQTFDRFNLTQFLSERFIPDIYKQLVGSLLVSHTVPIVTLDGEVFSNPKLLFFSLLQPDDGDDPKPYNSPRKELTLV